MGNRAQKDVTSVRKRKNYLIISPEDMKKINLLFIITLGGWLGWNLGDSFGIMTAYLMGFAGSLAGVFLGVIINKRYLD